MAIVNPTYTKLTDKGISFSLLRTNPKLTSNLKLTVDSGGKLWFNSIEATPELAQNKYKNFPIDPESAHEVNIFKFYDSGKTPTKISFAVGSTITTDTVAKDLRDQFDFDLYSSGAKYLTSKNYSEKFSYLAPLYLDSVIPEYFVIFKIPGASNYTVGEWKQKLAESSLDRGEFALNLFRSAVPIKAFSLKEDSGLGRYIRNILRNPMYNRNPLYVNYKQDRYSIYRGASISAGTYVEIPEMLSTTLWKSIPQLKLEQYVTEGFERNNVIHPRILNLEFLFNDDTSEEYTFNRYIGFYCNLIEFAEFDIDLEAMFENDDNDNPLPFQFRMEDEISINISNPNGVVLRGIGVDVDFTTFDQAMTSENSMFFPYLQAKDQALHFPKVQSMEQVNSRIKFSLHDTVFDLGLTFGPGELFSQEKAKASTIDTRTTVSVEFLEVPAHLDTLRVYHQNGSTFDQSTKDGRYDDIVFVKDAARHVFPNGEDYRLSYPTVSVVSFNTEEPNAGSPTFTPNEPEILGRQYLSSITGQKWIWNGSTYVTGAIGSRIYVNLFNADTYSSTDRSILGKYRIDGYLVYDSSYSSPIANATVHLKDGPEPVVPATSPIPNILQSCTTNEYGYFEFYVENGTYYLYAETDADWQGVTTEDVNQIRRYIANLEPNTLTNDLRVRAADINQDGVVDGGDPIPLGRRINGLLPNPNFKIADWLFDNPVVTVDGENVTQNMAAIVSGNVTGSYIPSFSVNTFTDLSKLARTVVEIVQKLKNSFLTGKTFESTAFLQVSPVGNKYGELAVQALGSLAAKIKINGSSTTETVYADGGAQSTTQAIIPIGNVARLMPILDQIVVKTEKDWSKILRVCNSVSSVDSVDSLEEINVSDYLDFATLMLKDNEPAMVVYDVIEIRSLFKPKLGLLSIFETKDIDFYTYTSQYAKIPDIDLYQYYYVPKNTKILDFTKYVYKMVGSGTIEINGITYSTDSTDLNVWQSSVGLHEYSVINGDVILVQSDTVTRNPAITRNDIAIYDEDKNLHSFSGFFAFGADHSQPDPNSPTYEYREKYKANNLLSEYHVYLENFSKDFSNTSRVIPYISKWGILDSVDARGNPYRLNSDIMFGKDNFGPSQHETSPTPEKLTHEWFYIESDFNYSLAGDLLKKNYYYFNEPFDWSELVSSPSYFERYFTYIPTIDGEEIDKPQFRYSKLYRDAFTKQYSTVFNGARFVFSELDENGEVLPSTDRFNDYNFSVLLKPIKEDLLNPQVPIKYRIIENVDSKSILVLIELAISDSAELNSQLLLKDQVILPDYRFDQTSMFFDGFAIQETKADVIPIKYSYTTRNTPLGDAEFNYLLSSAYPSFANGDYRDGGYTTELSSGTITGDPVIPKPGEAFIIKKESDPYVNFICVFEDSTLFDLAHNLKISGVCVNAMITVSGTQYLQVGPEKNCYLDGYPSKLRIVRDCRTDLRGIALDGSDLRAIRILPAFLSTFGDYRLQFNENGVSNLTYNFLYSAKDKKYNSTKASYSTVKLAVGIDISPQGVNPQPPNYFMAGQSLTGTAIDAFKLEDFINPISGAHDTLTNTIMPSVEAPLPAFSPIMFISGSGEVKLLLNTTAFVDIDPIPVTLSDPTKTTHAINRVSENLLTVTGNDLVLAKIELIADPTFPTMQITKQNFISGAPTTWLVDHQQFQLFGGKDYFANLFENLSFANFKSLLNKNSNIISWESYSNGVKINGQKIKIEIEEGDLIEKETVVAASPEIVETASKNEVGGFSHTEELSTVYDLYRYSGEYEIIFRPMSGFKQTVTLSGTTITGANVYLNTTVSDFFVIPEFSFVKYSEFNILDLETSTKFEPVYPMIYESSIDFDEYYVLSSSWDFDYHYDYSSKKNRLKIPGSRRITEDYSFVSKLLNVPLAFTAETFIFTELSNREFEVPDSDFVNLKINGDPIEFAYSSYPGEIRFRINFSQVIAKALSETTASGETKLRSEFQKFFVDEFGNPIVTDPVSLGKLTFTEYLYEYCKTNLIKLYELDTIDFYEKADHSIADNAIQFVDVPYDQLDDAGYVSIKAVKINNTTNNDTITGSIAKKQSAGISLVPKLKIKYI